MAIQLAAFIPVIIYLTIAGGAGFALYQLRMSVESVEEIFTDEGSSINTIAFQALVGAGAVYLLTKAIK